MHGDTNDCFRCKWEGSVRLIREDQDRLVFGCRMCGRTWSVLKNTDPRPVFERSPAEAA